MKKYEIKITNELIQKLLQGIKIQQIYGDDIMFTIYPPQEGRFITMEELDEIISDSINVRERLLKIMEY